MAGTFFLPTAENGESVLLSRLEDDLDSGEWTYFGYMTAFARRSGTRLLTELLSYHHCGCIEFIVGRDLHGTSAEALSDIVDVADSVTLTYDKHPRKTFHPKVVLIENDENFIAYVGSNNLTGGGLVTNYEATLKVTGQVGEEIHQQISDTFDEIREADYSLALDRDVLQDLIENEIILPERQIRSPQTLPPLPGRLLDIEPSDGISLLMEIRPHPNGEILLSKRALDERPDFFGWPWSGETVPKRGENTSYPQFDPKPVIRLRVFDVNGELVHEQNWDLTMVLYERKSEVRITIPPSVSQMLNDFDLLRMEQGNDPYDYHLDFIIQGSELHGGLHPLMDNTLPSGGKPRARRWGFTEV